MRGVTFNNRPYYRNNLVPTTYNTGLIHTRKNFGMPPTVRLAVFFFAGGKISPEKFVYMEQNCYLCDVVNNKSTFL